MAELGPSDQSAKGKPRNGMLPDLSRRQFMMAGGATALAAALAKRAEIARELLVPASSRVTRSAAGTPSFPNMAPASEQFFVDYRNSVGATYKALDFYETVYARAPLADNFSTPLVRINSAYQIVPGVAHSWKQTSADDVGVLHHAGDHVDRRQRAHRQRLRRDVPLLGRPQARLGLHLVLVGRRSRTTPRRWRGRRPSTRSAWAWAKDKYTFVVTTEGPVAFMAYAMLYSMPLSAAGLAKYGNGLYNVNPATAISMRPLHPEDVQPDRRRSSWGRTRSTTPGYKLADPVPDRQDLLPARPTCPLLETGVVDDNSDISLAKTDLAIAKATPKVNKLTPYINPLDFRVYYVFFKTKAAPFNNLKVRQAFAHSCDRDSIISALLAPLATPAYGYLMERLPLRGRRAAREVHQLRPGAGPEATGRGRLPEGQGLPVGDLQLRGRRRRHRRPHDGVRRAGPGRQLEQRPVRREQHAPAGGAGHRDVLQEDGDAARDGDRDGLHLLRHGLLRRLQHAERVQGRWAPRLGQRPVRRPARPGRGRRSTKTKRQEIYTEAQVLLTSQAPAVFVFHGLGGYLMWPYVQGPTLAKNYLGYDGLQWPGFFPFSTYQEGLYIANNVGSYPRQGESGLI